MSSKKPKETEPEVYGEASGTRKRKHAWFNFSYTTRVTASFALIAAMTALVAIGVLSFVWEQHFQAYTRDNLQKQADNVATSIATKYVNNGGDLRRDGVLTPAESATSLNPGLGIQVMAAGTDGVNDSILYDNTRSANGEGGVSLAPSNRSNIVSSSIVVEGKVVGTVRMWVPGSELMLSKGDVLFREQSYQAMIFAAALAIVLALGIGFLFARGLVNPINRMTSTAKDIKKGDLSARTGLTGDDEVSRLGETFDEMAESIEKDRELERRLTTDVAHELRTPLMAIQSTVEAMVDGVFEPNAERLETVNSEVQRLGRLVEALLKLSRLENRSSPMSKEVINVGDLISGIVATHEAFVADSGLSLRYERENDVFVCGDADMLRQATANLISNAVRYTPEGGVITVKVTKGDLMARIMVQDTGIGLSPEDIKMVFSRFWRADAGRDRASGGLGIGLAVVKEIVDRHGGWVRVEGKLDEGACFTIYVPLYNEESAKNREKMKFKNKNAS
ncbi:MAG: HAMP domain-containing sensor histidine kinase [Raoultibacter sp.]